MSFLGCLGFLVVFILLFVLSVAGSIVNTIWTFLRGGSSTSHNRQQSSTQSSAPHGGQKPNNANDDYVFKPNDGEYIDFEEV